MALLIPSYSQDFDHLYFILPLYSISVTLKRTYGYIKEDLWLMAGSVVGLINIAQ